MKIKKKVQEKIYRDFLLFNLVTCRKKSTWRINFFRAAAFTLVFLLFFLSKMHFGNICVKKAPRAKLRGTFFALEVLLTFSYRNSLLLTSALSKQSLNLSATSKELKNKQATSQKIATLFFSSERKKF